MTILMYLVFAYVYRENISSPMALFSVSLLKENLSNKKGKNGKKREKSHFHVFSIKQRCFLHPPKIAKIKRGKKGKNHFYSIFLKVFNSYPKNGKTLKYLLSPVFFDPKSQEFPFIIRISIPNHLIFAIPIHAKGFQGIFAICGEFLIYE